MGEGVKEPAVVPLAAQTAAEHDAGVVDREVMLDGVRWALVEYGPGCARAGWCSTPHSGFVASGSITYDFEDGREPLEAAAGQGYLLPSSPRHRGRNPGAMAAVLFLIDSLPAD